jgi:hypothetical protein
MKTLTRLTLLLLVLSAVAWGQTHPDTKALPAASQSSASCGLDRSDIQAEKSELNLHTSRMESRIVMIRNSAGTVQDPQVRNALQVDADMWQDEVDYLRKQAERLQTVADRCEAREKISGTTK